MNDQEQMSPRRRLQMLLAISDYDRTDAEWDELAELEISLSPANKVGAPDPAGANSSSANRKRLNNSKPKMSPPVRKPQRKPRTESSLAPVASSAEAPAVAADNNAAAPSPAAADAGDKPAGGTKRGFRRTPRRRTGPKSGTATPGAEPPKAEGGE